MSRARDLSKLVNPSLFSVSADNNVGVNSTAPVETCPAPAPKETKKKVSKKKTTSPLSD